MSRHSVLLQTGQFDVVIRHNETDDKTVFAAPVGAQFLAVDKKLISCVGSDKVKENAYRAAASAAVFRTFIKRLCSAVINVIHTFRIFRRNCFFALS